MDGWPLFAAKCCDEASDAARFEVYMRDHDDRAIIMKLYGTHFTRLLHVPFEEGNPL